jgi:ssDNA-binding Zn-finger/Zn-ribbon topoisomerase 1
MRRFTMSVLDRLLGRKPDKGSSTKSRPKLPKFLRKEQKGNSTYEIYKAGDPETAKAFLATKRVDKPLYYIIVETDEGNWGIDVKGIYLERLLPWQKEIGSAQCEGHVARFPDTFGLQLAAKGINDNFVAVVKCGKCEHEWSDGLRYQNVTIVRCPKCRSLNKVDSANYKCIFV